MCAQFALKTEANKLSLQGEIKISEDLKTVDSRFLPHSIAPVIVSTNNDFKLTGMHFSLVPSWCKKSKVKFATHNARIESVTEKPTWKIPFKSQYCLVPITSFFESVYTGPEAGNIIEFKQENNNLLFAAGLFDFWKDVHKPELSFYSFTILTQAPSDFILEHGHDRIPIFVKDELVLDWLNNINKETDLVKSKLLSISYHPELIVSIDRPLKAGWENRK